MEAIYNLYNATQGEDDLGVVVRSHIIIEQTLNKFIESFMHDVGEYRKLHLDFEETVKLAVALGLNKRYEPPLKALGKLRNQFAHTMRSAISKQDANNLYKSFSSDDKHILQKALENTRKILPDSDVGEYKNLAPKEQFTFNVVVLNGALETAIARISNQ